MSRPGPEPARFTQIELWSARDSVSRRFHLGCTNNTIMDIDLKFWCCIKERCDIRLFHLVALYYVALNVRVYYFSFFLVKLQIVYINKLAFAGTFVRINWMKGASCTFSRPLTTYVQNFGWVTFAYKIEVKIITANYFQNWVPTLRWNKRKTVWGHTETFL